MICKLLLFLTAILINVHGNELSRKQQLAIISQNLHRIDMPLPYNYNKFHKRPNKQNLEQTVYHQNINPVKLPSIQYAPLNRAYNLQDYQNGRKVYEDNFRSEPTHQESGRHEYETKKRDHLEPRPLTENYYEYKQNYDSIVLSSHELLSEALITRDPPRETVALPQRNHNKQQVKLPMLVYCQKTKQNFMDVTPEIKNEEHQTTVNYREHKLILHKYNAEAQKEPRLNPFLQSVLSMEKPTQTHQNPRIHLNIARIYNIANQPREEYFPQILSPQMMYIVKPIKPENTIMYPVKKAVISNSVFMS